jgi:hypothetical protein
MSLTRWARSSMSDPQSYDERVSRLADSRRSDSAAKRAAVLKALNQLQREDRRISRKVVIARAGVHRNFLQRHKDLADLIDGAAGGARADSHLRPRDRIGQTALSPNWRTPNSEIWRSNRRCASSNTGSAHRGPP